MIRALLVALLTATSFSASAAWTEYGEIDGTVQFIDFTSIRKDGNIRTFWTMSNFKQRNDKGDMSSRHKESINCKNETITILHYSSFSKPNLGGKMTTDASVPPRWTHIPPQTASAEMMRLVCSR